MSTAARFQIRGWHVLAGMLAFFGVIIAVNIAFAVIAVRSFPGEDVRRSYLQGIRYNDALAERRAQAALGWQAAASLRQRDGEAILEISLRQDNGAPINAAALSGALQWPTQARFDRELAFTPIGDGRYEARLGALQSGRWRLRAHAENEAGALDFESGLRWPPSR
jgi:nitrogen fixation protein FixH